MSVIACTDFLVRKLAHHESRLAVRELPERSQGEVLLKVDCFAFTANNITYIVFGDRLAYWQFFPSADSAWGRVPVWGFAEVLESKHAEISVGERLYGYLPMSTHLVIAPGRVSEGLVTDARLIACRCPVFTTPTIGYCETQATTPHMRPSKPCCDLCSSPPS